MADNTSDIVERLRSKATDCHASEEELYREAADEIERLRKAMEKIERWYGEFPESGREWEPGRSMSYGAAFGSNGERDYMRKVAREALAGK